jgi:quercetin dioxygenase-like cupin family protein
MVKEINVGELSWEPHPTFSELLVKKLLSHEMDKVDLTIMMIRARKGIQVPAHEHEQDDIVYQLEGKCKMWVEGVGDFDMSSGSFIRIPAGIRHQPHHFEEDVVAVDIFSPHLF